MTEEQEIAIAIKGDEWASTKTADRGGYYFAGLSEGYYNGYLVATKELQEELEKWKAEWQEQVQKATNEGYARTQLQIENGKLKEQIEIDAEQMRALQKQKGELTDQVYELKDRLNEEIELHQHAEDYIKSLEAQVDKMRNCANCKNYNSIEGFCVLGSGYGYNCNLEKWEIKEK